MSQACPAAGGTTGGWERSPWEAVASVQGVSQWGQQGQWSGKRAGHRTEKTEDKLESAGTTESEFHCSTKHAFERILASI